MTREEWLVDSARWALRFLVYQTHGSQDRVLARRLHEALLSYDDFEPSHDTDRAEWRKRIAAKLVK